MQSLVALAGRKKGDTVAHTYRSVQPSSVIHCDKQLAFHTVQANHSSGHSGDLYETCSNRTSMLHTVKRLRGTQNNKACGGWNLCRCQLWMRKRPLSRHWATTLLPKDEHPSHLESRACSKRFWAAQGAGVKISWHLYPSQHSCHV